MTWAPAWLASSAERSVEPLSTTRTSPELPELDNQASALATHTATVSASLRQGMTIEMRGARAAVIGIPRNADLESDRSRQPHERLGARARRGRAGALRRARGTSRAVAVLVRQDVPMAEVGAQSVPRDVDLVEAPVAGAMADVHLALGAADGAGGRGGHEDHRRQERREQQASNSCHRDFLLPWSGVLY